MGPLTSHSSLPLMASAAWKVSSPWTAQTDRNGRGFSTLLLLAAGTMTDVNGAVNFTQQFAINGQRGVEAVFAMDGADRSERAGLQHSVASGCRHDDRREWGR